MGTKYIILVAMTILVCCSACYAADNHDAVQHKTEILREKEQAKSEQGQTYGSTSNQMDVGQRFLAGGKAAGCDIQPNRVAEVNPGDMPIDPCPDDGTTGRPPGADLHRRGSPDSARTIVHGVYSEINRPGPEVLVCNGLLESCHDSGSPGCQIQNCRRIMVAGQNTASAFGPRGGLNSDSAWNRPPTVAVAGRPGGTIHSNNVASTWTGADTGGQLADYYRGLDNSTRDARITGAGRNSHDIVEGSHILYVRAQDRDAATRGATRAPLTYSASEDNPPTIDMISPSDGETVSGTVRFQTYATDDIGLDRVEFYIDDELKVTHGPWSPPYNVVGSTCTWDCDTTPGSIHHIPNGTHTFKAIACDYAAQIAIASISFIVNNEEPNAPPTVSITGGPSGTIDYNDVTFTWSGSDTDGWVAGYYYSLGDSTPDNWTTETSHTFYDVSEGSHTFYVKAEDNEGAQSEVASRSFTYSPPESENDPPTASFAYSPENPVVGEEIIFDASSSTDPDGEIVSYEWDWDSDGSYDESTASVTATHSWDEEGTHQVGLRVTDDDGATDTAGKEVTLGLPENRRPDPPTDLTQFEPDGQTQILVGDTTHERTVIFKGTVSDPDGDKIKLQIELRRLDEFSGEFDENAGGFKESDLVESGSGAVAHADGLIDADYHWRARTVDEHGRVSGWADFGNNDISEADFTVVAPLSLLEKYAPVLYFHDDEKLYPWGVYSMLNYSDLKNGREISGPRLEDLEEAPFDTAAYLDLNVDVPPWPDGWNDYPYRVYGRRYEPPSHPDKVVLQYWFFYPFNRWETLTGDYADHEGDWEMIQIILNRKTSGEPEPEEICYSHHWDANCDNWYSDRLQLIQQTHPCIFVALGGHGCWITPEDHPVLGGSDKTSSRGRVLYPSDYELEDISAEQPWWSEWPIWAHWEGKWGAELRDLFSKPPDSPGNIRYPFEDQDRPRWADPIGWRVENELKREGPSYSQVAANACTTPAVLEQKSGTQVSPSILLHAYDSYGNHVGLIEAGEIEATIPGTYLYVPSSYGDGKGELMWIYTSEDLRFEIKGSGEGTSSLPSYTSQAETEGEFDFTFNRYLKEQDREITVTYQSVQFSEDTIAVVDVNPENPRYLMKIDLDGDGIVDKIREPDVIEGVSILDLVIAYPNPVYLSKGQVVKITPLPSGSKIYIYTISGELVKTLEEHSGIAIWDCRNDAGQIVPRGIYVYLIISNAEKKTGKIAIIK